MHRGIQVWGLVCAVGLIALASASATTSRTAVGSRNTKEGQIIVAGSNHHTLYGFGNDGRDKSACYGACSRTWIPLGAKGQIVAVKRSGVNGRHLGKFRRRNGSWQVTYYGQPLYLYKRDTKPGQIRCHKYLLGWHPIDVNGSPAPPCGYARDVPAHGRG
jgi:predicted lipoprotein with Yx(FWY)xxD motif